MTRCPNQPDRTDTHPPATVRFGARDYCPACAAELELYVHSIRVDPVPPWQRLRVLVGARQ